MIDANAEDKSNQIPGGSIAFVFAGPTPEALIQWEEDRQS